ncbi:MAG: KH domain-containing protein [Bacilli bacterium]|nr:KH domain-containing protein [Bacilli bacterium]
MKIEVYEFNGINEEDCRVKCLDSLDVYNNEIITKEISNENEYILEVIKKDDVKQYISEFLNELGNKMNIKLNFNIYEEENVFFVRISSNNNPILIGKEGRTLNSIQYLLRKSISNAIGFNININMDVSNYKKKIEKRFEEEIKKIINEVMKTRIETKLDPMNSYRRRIVHSIASNYYNIETHSVGEEPNRYTVIKYVEK